MKTISKHFDNQDDANDFYLDLCEQYDSVKLIRAPLFSEAGVYAWQCS
jgi:hypothetical protein